MNTRDGRWDRFVAWSYTDTSNPRRRRRWIVIIVVSIVFIVVMWVFALFFASRTNRNRIKDRAWADRSEQICATARVKINALPAAITAKSPQDRAKVVDQANAYVDDMVRQLSENKVSDTAHNTNFVTQWVIDYQAYAKDRHATADELRQGKDVLLAVTNVNGLPIDQRMDEFAKTNSMPSCKVPGDL